MFKVICIDATSEPGWEPIDLVEGNIYTVIRELKDSRVWYNLEGHCGWYEAKYLIPISEIDEMELIKEKMHY